MPFISYAQNLEDVLLWRALKNVGSGFYIDVGACDPLVHSITKAFYNKNWRGINIEPMKCSFELVKNARPRDINLYVAVGAQKEIKKFYSIDSGNGLSTSIKKYADKYRIEGKKVEEILIETTTLADICQQYVNQEIHFLKIDVEGDELSVLKGADFKKYRPWIVLIESTEPNSTLTTHANYESCILEADYTFVYFDGLNRFYVANEKLELLQHAFTTPINVFDDYETHINPSIISELNLIKGKLQDVTAKINKNTPIAKRIDILPHAVDHLASTQMLFDIKTEISQIEKIFSMIQMELDECHQELYESSRYIGFLSKERSNLQQLVNSIPQNRYSLKRITSVLINPPRLIRAVLRRIQRYTKQLSNQS